MLGRWVAQPFGTIQRFLGLDVGSCWGYVGSRWPQVGSKMAQDRFFLAQVGSKTSKMAPKGFPTTPRWGQNGFQMSSKSLCFSFTVVFSPFASRPTFSCEIYSLGALKVSIFVNFGTNFNEFWIIFGIKKTIMKKTHKCYQEANPLTQVGLIWKPRDMQNWALASTRAQFSDVACVQTKSTNRPHMIETYPRKCQKRCQELYKCRLQKIVKKKTR